MQVSVKFVLEDLLLLTGERRRDFKVGYLVPWPETVDQDARVGDAGQADPDLGAVEVSYHLAGTVNCKCIAVHVLLSQTAEVTVSPDVEN